ncbi:exonuclease subunit SbcD [Marinomonas posidonica]|uniref:exonuclease subunit SbcD n=1 Tax=Marinomonas posidonica TaxID=936476 RepID=UPI00373553C8
MKILHTSDWHLGQHFMGKSRREEHKAFIEWLLTVVERESIEAVIIAGDVFDTGSPPSYAREMYHQLVLEMRARTCQLVVIAGNHDSVSMLNESKSLLAYLDVQVISQADLTDLDSHVVTLKDRRGNEAAWLCAVPYLRPKDIMQSQSGQSEQDKKEGLLKQIKDFYLRLYQLAALRNADRKKPLPIIGTGHLTAFGSQLSESVRDLYVGTLDTLPTSVFPPFDYLALGHIHRPQAIGNNGCFRYSGSPIALSFDELGRDKSVVILDTELLSTAMLSKDCNVMTDLFAEQEEPVVLKPIPCFQPMVSLQGDLQSLLSQIEGLSCEEGKTIWLEVSVLADEYLSDLHKQLLQVVEGKPIELLRVMRRRAQGETSMAFTERQTLSELSVEEVFDRSVTASLDLKDEEKTALSQLFQQCLEDVNEQMEGHGKVQVETVE